MARMPETLLLSDLVIRGETHAIRTDLKRYGFLWDPDQREWRSGWSDYTHPPEGIEYERPGLSPDGVAAEEFVRGLSANRPEGVEIGYYAPSGF